MNPNTFCLHGSCSNGWTTKLSNPIPEYVTLLIYYVRRKANENQWLFIMGIEFAKNAYAYVLKGLSCS